LTIPVINETGGLRKPIWKKHDEVVEPACEVDMIAEVTDKEVDLVWRPAYDEATAHHQ